MQDFKITKKVELSRKLFSKNEIIIFYANDIEIARCKKYSDYFCTIKNGAPSLIRDKFKKCYETSWNRQGLEELLGVKVKVGTRRFGECDFYDSYPDTTWGDQGSLLNPKKIKQLLEEFVNSKIVS